MTSDPDQTIIADLKAARDEIEKDYHTSTPAPKFIPEKKTDLFQTIGKHQKELYQEQSALEEAYQKTKELTEKIAGRIELLKKMQAKSAEIDMELKKFEEQVVAVKKENCDFLNQIKKEKHG